MILFVEVLFLNRESHLSIRDLKWWFYSLKFFVLIESPISVRDLILVMISRWKEIIVLKCFRTLFCINTPKKKTARSPSVDEFEDMISTNIEPYPSPSDKEIQLMDLYHFLQIPLQFPPENMHQIHIIKKKNQNWKNEKSNITEVRKQLYRIHYNCEDITGWLASHDSGIIIQYFEFLGLCMINTHDCTHY